MTIVRCHGRSTKAVLCAPLLTLALLTGLTGCGDGGGAEGAKDASQSRKSPDGKGSSSPSPKERSKASASASPLLPEAADGTETGACDDGECEVVLSKGDELHPKSSYGVDEFSVRSIKDHVITWTALFSGGQVSMSAEGAGESSTSCTNGSCNGRLGRSKGKIEMNGLTVEFKAIGKDSAVAKLSPKK
jgi:hypothetical protein